MVYLAHTAHPQYAAMWLGAVGWILTVVTTGLVEWRVWVVADVSVITSGMVWVGIWRVCFFSHILVSPELRVMFCQKMRLSDAFTPWEIAVAQVLMMVAAVLGLLASASVIYGLRNIFFGLDKKIHILVAFSLGGVLYLLTAVCSLIPLCLNFNSVVQNQTIAFPDIFHVPPAPVEQHVGGGIAVGISASIMMVTSGIVFLTYQFPLKMDYQIQSSWPAKPQDSNPVFALSSPLSLVCSKDRNKVCGGKDNLAFESQKHA